LVGGGLHHRYRHPRSGTKVLQGAARQRVVPNAETVAAASGFTAMSVTARLTRTR
jgi:hypothetical protein